MFNTTLIAVRNPKWVSIKDDEGNVLTASDGNPWKVIDCEAQWTHLGDSSQDWLPFCATHLDVEKHGRDLYAALVNGDHGTIADE